MKTFTFSLTWIVLSALTVSAAERWQPLWDGKTLSGWHIIGKGEWKIENGAIHGTHLKTEHIVVTVNGMKSAEVMNDSGSDVSGALETPYRMGTSNVQHRTPNAQGAGVPFIRCSRLDVECLMFRSQNL